MKALILRYFSILFPGFLVALSLSKGTSSVLEVGLLVFSVLINGKALLSKPAGKYLPALSVVLIFVAYLVGMLYTDNIKAGFKLINVQHSLLVIPIIIYLNKEQIQKHSERYLGWFIGGASIAGLVTVAINLMNPLEIEQLTKSYAFLEPFKAPEHDRYFGMYSPFNSRIQLSNILGMAAVCNLYLLSQKPTKWWWWISLVAVIGSSLALGGRGGQLALLLGMYVFVSAWLVKKIYPRLRQKMSNQWAVILLVLGMLVVSVGAPFLAYQTVPTVKLRYGQLFWELDLIESGEYVNYDYYHFTSLRRVISWKNTWQLIQENPILGTGTGDYKDELERIYANDEFGDIPANNHNQFLHYWACLGIWGLALFLTIVIFWLIKIASPSQVYVLALAFMGFYLLSMMPDAILLRQSDNMMFALFFSWLGVWAVQQKEEVA